MSKYQKIYHGVSHVRTNGDNSHSILLQQYNRKAWVPSGDGWSLLVGVE